jgi:hypothetical protein
MSEIEQRLRYALVPVEPPRSLTDRLDARLTELTDAAADELAKSELRAMSDPRNWLRPVAAAAVCGLAGGALVLVRARQQQRKRHVPGITALERGVREVVGEVRQRFDRSSLERGVRDVVGDVRQRLPR